MSKQQLIDAIRDRNVSAEPDFLAAFDERSLAVYLTRLTQLAGHRGRGSVWVRHAEEPVAAAAPAATETELVPAAA